MISGLFIELPIDKREFSRKFLYSELSRRTVVAATNYRRFVQKPIRVSKNLQQYELFVGLCKRFYKFLCSRRKRIKKSGYKIPGFALIMHEL